MRFLTVIFISIICFSCKKEDDLDPATETTDISEGLSTSSNVLICNEGNFGWGNATISLFNNENKILTDSIFQSINGFEIGDICQSAVLFNGKIYVVLNNSGKVEVVDATSFKSLSTIDDLISPRYFLPVSDNKAYISDLYSNSISVIDLSTHATSKSIPCKGWTEEMILKDNVAYVTNIESDWLYLVNTSDDIITDSILVGNGVGSIQKDSLNTIWLLRANDNPALLRINNDNSTTEFPLDLEANPSKLRYSANNHSLYFIKGDVCVFNISAESFTDDFIVSDDKIFYGLGVNPNNGNIFVSDAKDFVQSSTIYIYSSDGSLITNFSSGINTGFFLYKNQ